ncbi:increased loss of mitochondrial DNA protein 1 [Phaeosphaeria sp. MPI-PUGE-AT-0046c]|nr:increased loss of mitochondrial DNA protein 1 [Phaeosphaeria sp. MPI-PUGE-AT-0046c]
MAIISANAMIRSLSLFHMTLAAILLRNPQIIANQSIVLVLGQSMQLPTPREFLHPSASIAFLGVLFALLGLSDLTAVSMSEELSDEYWGLQTPVRLLFLFALTAYTYTFKEGGMMAPRSNDYMMSKGNTNLNNSIVFTWGFMEMAAWFWVFVTLREERREKVNKLIEKRKREAENL